MNRRSADARAPVVLLALGCVWGASFLFIKVLVDDTGPLEVATGRLCIGAVAIMTFIRLRGLPLTRTPSLIGKVSILALVANIAPFALIAWGEEHIESGTASVLNSTMPIFTALFATVVLPEERFTTARASGLVVSFLGVLVLTGNDTFDLTSSSVLGQLAVILSSACYGVGSVFSRTLLRSTDPLGLSALQVAAGAVLSVPILLAVEGIPDYSLSIEAWLCLLALGAGATGVAYVAYLWLIDVTGSVRASLVTYVIPLVGLFLGWAVLNESIGVDTLLGTVLIIGGVAIVFRGSSPGTQVRPVAPVAAAD
ncbi:MAG: DMT family transporter [Chloroflexi bacterium]|nr:MAG: DMT family transporter [Chloroflexota bacterium]